MKLRQFTAADFTEVICKHLDQVTARQWEDIKAGTIGPDTMKTLDDMWTDLTVVCISAVKEAAPPCGREDSLRVSREEVQAGLGDSLHHCFGAAMNLNQTWSHNSDHVTKALVEAVVQQVNGCGSRVGGVQDPSGRGSDQDSASISSDRTFSLLHLGYIFKRVVNGGPTFGKEVPPRLEVSRTPEPDLSLSGGPLDSAFPAPQKIFVSIFLHKLMDHIACVTNTSILDLNFPWLVERLMERTGGQVGLTLPDYVGNLHVRIFKDLRWDFGSSRKLYCAIFNDTQTFLDAVASELRAALERSSRKAERKARGGVFCPCFGRGTPGNQSNARSETRPARPPGWTRPVINLEPLARRLSRLV